MRAKLVKENINIEKWEVIFTDYGDNETIVEQKFDTYEEADKWAYDNQYEYQDEAYDNDGNEYWKTFYRYYNPEDKESYVSYDVQQVK